MVYHDHQLSKRNTGQNRAISWLKACYSDVGSKSTCNWFIVLMHMLQGSHISFKASDMIFQFCWEQSIVHSHCNFFRVIDTGGMLVEPGANGRAILPSFVMTHLQRSLCLALSQHSRKFFKPSHSYQLNATIRQTLSASFVPPGS